MIRTLRPQTDAATRRKRRQRFGRLAGTFSPSHRQIRSARFLFTVRPAQPNNPPVLLIVRTPTGKMSGVPLAPDLPDGLIEVPPKG